MAKVIRPLTQSSATIDQSSGITDIEVYLAALAALIDTGRLKVDGEFTIEQLGTLVIEQIKIKNAAGDVVNPATLEGQNATNTALSAAARSLLAITRVSVDTTVNGKTLAALLGTALNTGVRAIVLTNLGGVTISFLAGNVAAGSGDEIWPGQSVTIPGDKAALDTLKFIAAATCAMSVRQI